MATDPLEKATRDTKRNLLLTSLAIITLKAFNVTIEQIPLANLTIKFDSGALGFLLAVGLIYFLCTFVLYYYIDIRNVENTKHQNDMLIQVRDRPFFYKEEVAGKIMGEVRKILPAGYQVSVSDAAHTFAKMVAPRQLFGAKPVLLEYSMMKHEAVQGRNTTQIINRASDPELFAKIDEILVRRSRTLYWRFKANELWHRFTGARVSGTYHFRNYVVDGGLPVALAVYALLVLCGITSADWIRTYSPVIKPTP